MEFNYEIHNKNGTCDLTLNIEGGSEKEIFDAMKVLRETFKDQWPNSSTATTWHKEVEDLQNSGQKLAAVKRLKEKTGLGLKEAKDAVDHYQAYGTWNITSSGALNSPF